MKSLSPFFCALFLLVLFACDTDEKLDPCQEANGTVQRNGETRCALIGQAAIRNVNQPGHQALLSFRIYEARVTDGLDLSMEIDLPESGLELNRAYAITAGTFAEQETITSGNVTFTRLQGNYWEGTFVAESAQGARSNSFTNGNFKSNFEILD
ncbi:hypothetical protein QWY31_10670 [Cytophagales bacterium LB-30]|uniref:Lipoprotein n=1 Tax=Shiella aurantiaca TaxID=3058365 RepID=A0ABT8F681_9BACT|nr:hypothetical protein [Shiella aurantiaca]MDN4165967.1 hypothetical protein [Shiella aurantiaca]